MSNKTITVTSPLLPSLLEYTELLHDIWERKWLTNNGYYHQELEKKLSDYLHIPYISLFSNGTLPLITALQALHITGEVITTPYSFVATTHAILWNNLKPVFVDIDPLTGNIDPSKIEAAITSQTTAIMPVHVYGNPCDTMRIKSIADAHGLKVIYDAAHAFGVTINGRSILDHGDMSTLSFHATKVYNTVEGGGLVVKDEETKMKIDSLKNFGFSSETEIIDYGINAKMDELRAAFGLLTLKMVDNAIEKRKRIVKQYCSGLMSIPGIRFFSDIPGVKHNYAYFPIFVDEQEYGMNRDALYQELKNHNILGRRYFYPLISDFSVYKGLDSARADNLCNAHKMSEQVICLPVSTELQDADVERVIKIIKDIK